MPTVTDSDTTLADGTVQTLTDTVDNKYFTFKIDLSEMSTGDADVMTLIIYDVVLSAGAYGIYRQETYTGTQADPIKFLAPLWITEKIKVTLEQTAGVNKNYPWVLLEA
jgi:hypothetical protein